jgi:hypothetical protein
VFSGQKSASVSTAAQLRMMPSCEQSPARPVHSISHIRDMNAGGWGHHTAAPFIASLVLAFSGPSGCHYGKRTRGICIQLAAPGHFVERG